MLLIERSERIAVLTLNRPEKSNALHPDLVEALLTALAGIASDPELQVVILTGAGRIFCAGLDLENTLESSDPPQQLARVFDLFKAVRSLPQPVIAAINGSAIAGGFDLAQFCDLRLAVPEAKFAQAEIKLGLTQMIYPLYKSIGLARARELALTGDTISAEEAWRIGFVNHVVAGTELLPRARELAGRLAARPREALFETKRLSWELPDLQNKEAFERMGSAIRIRLESEEFRQSLIEFKKEQESCRKK